MQRDGAPRSDANFRLIDGVALKRDRVVVQCHGPVAILKLPISEGRQADSCAVNERTGWQPYGSPVMKTEAGFSYTPSIVIAS